MKNVILGTTALVAATALSAGSASAAEKIALELGGYFTASFYGASYDGPDRLPTKAQHEGEVHFTGKTTLDNGLEIGVQVQLEARATNDQVDEAFMWFSGAFGRVNVGSENSASYLMHTFGTSPVPDWGLNDANANATNVTPATATTGISDADKITYFTPRFAGFQLGASYTPDGSCESGATCRPFDPINLEGVNQEEEAYSIGVNYVQTFNAIDVRASLGYELTNAGLAGQDDREETSAGVAIGIAGFKFGGSYKKTDNFLSANDLDTYEANLTYGMGAWRAGVQYAYVKPEAADSDVQAVVIGGQYVLGPGITAFGGVQLWDGDSNADITAQDTQVYFVGTKLSF
ncbi:MAG: porin [Proteobacteria bacterium]|nr:porin [Pseudomonadota bacterium]